MKRMLSIFLLCILILAGCAEKDAPTTDATANGLLPGVSYAITYGDNVKNWLLQDFNAPTGAISGETVILRAEGLLDADLMFYYNGVAMELTHADSDYWEYRFIMPEKDVQITYKIFDGFPEGTENAGT